MHLYYIWFSFSALTSLTKQAEKQKSKNSEFYNKMVYFFLSLKLKFPAT